MMEFPFERFVNGENETAELAGEFARLLTAGDVVALNGHLGAGKTFFVQSILKCFGIDTANSPTFAIVNEYYGAMKAYHFDFYRINKVEELYDIGFDEYVGSGDAVTFIEWADMMPDILPRHRYEVNIEVNDDFSRLFKIDRTRT